MMLKGRSRATPVEGVRSLQCITHTFALKFESRQLGAQEVGHDEK